MGLVLELQNKINDTRNAVMENIRQKLEARGTRAGLSREAETDYFGNETHEPVLELKGSAINRVKLLAYDYGTTTITFRFQYGLALDREPSRRERKELNARIKAVRKKGVMGLFGGEVSGTRWQGDGLAAVLNQDEALSAQITGLVRNAGDHSIELYVKPPREVELLGPRFSVPFSVLTDVAAAERLMNSVEGTFALDIFERIAAHVRAAAMV